jgi:hypothetical protein
MASRVAKYGIEFNFLQYLAGGLSIRLTKTKFMKLAKVLSVVKWFLNAFRVIAHFLMQRITKFSQGIILFIHTV